MSVRALRSHPGTFVGVALFVSLFLYTVWALFPYGFHHLHNSSVRLACGEIRPGMTISQAMEAVHRRLEPPEEIFNSRSQIIFVGYDAGCVVDTSQPDLRVVSAHVDPLYRTLNPEYMKEL